MQKESFVRRYGLLIGTGLAVGAAAVLLTFLGNPANMGFCIACFLRDIAGALNFQRAGFDADVGTGIVQYIRPEVIGLVLGSTAIAMAKKEFRPKGGSSPMIRFILAVFVMIGALVFLGCPLRMVIRIGGGDLNAVVGLVGFALGIIIGILVLKRGFSLRRAYQQSMAEGLIFPALMLALLALLVLRPDFIIFSAKGPGSMAAPVLVALAVALVIGVLAQRSRLCMVGGIRDAVMFKDFRLISGFAAIIAAVLVVAVAVNWICLGTEYSLLNQVLADSSGLTDETKADSLALTKEIAEEGIVLLKNDGDSPLPISKDAKLNVFGWGSTMPVYGGTGSGSVDESTAVTLLQGLKNAGFILNDELSQFYVDYCADRPVVGMGEVNWTVVQPTMDEYDAANVFEDAKSFSDTEGHWAAADIRKAVEAGWIRGVGGNRFAPDETITRAEVMTIVNRMLDRVPDAEHMLPDMKKWLDNPEDAWYYEAVQEATNEHDYDVDEFGAESWTEILKARDWKSLENEWANNGGMSASAEPVKPEEGAEGEGEAEDAGGEAEEA